MICSARPLLPKFPPEPVERGRAITAWIVRRHSPHLPVRKGRASPRGLPYATTPLAAFSSWPAHPMACPASLPEVARSS